MWFGPNLQRSYKYMMFASKMPSLRMDQSDLKCKNGCDYFGNPQWQGYCSKCHRELMHRQRKAEKAMSTTSTLPRADTKRAEQGPKVTSHSSFFKFEEKRLRQSETLKKANLLKLSMFKKSSNTAREQEQSERKPPEFKIPSMVSEGMKRDFRARFAALTPQVERDARTFVHNFILDVIKCANVMAVDELSERVQRQYQRYMKHMDTAPHYAQIDADTKEALVDFVEKHAMTYLHELPSVVFSPTGTDDERADRAMSERIQQLSWVGEKQLECKLDRASPTCRRLLYKAISELLGMDRAASPGGKLARVRRCCRHVLAVCAPRASADELLPALIFTVLKANPPRLVSNINFVTRFCNAQRLMTGEGGYYFTNLCCAVSFIENLTAESLTMDKKEFDCYMAMPASIGGSSWAAALSLCGETREAHEQRARAQQLLQQARELDARAAVLADNAASFQEQIEKKVQDVLSKTPLEIKPRRELLPLGKVKSKGVLIDLTENTPRASQDIVAEELPDSNAENNTNEETEQKTAQMLQEVESSHDLPNVFDLDVKDAEAELEPKLNILGFDEIDNPSPTKSSMILDQTWDLKQTNSMELLTPSPLGFTPFDSRSLDELMTPDEFGSDQIAPGLSNINYDIDLSDFSGDNSIADDVPKTEAKDPFSPDGIKKLEPIFDPFAVQPQPINTILDAFDEFSLVDTKRPTESDPFEVVPRRDPFEPISSQSSQPKDPFSPVASQSLSVDTFAVPKAGPSILDESDSPTAACLLPSPMLPQSSGKQT